jgi:hypothetical protein
MVWAARDTGLAGMAITDHDHVRTTESIRAELDGRFDDVAVIAAVEVTCFGRDGAVGHVLVFGGDPPPGPWDDAAAVARRVRKAGGCLVLAHPFRFEDGAHRLAEELSVDAIEVASGNVDSRASELARALACDLGLPAIAGSDAHQRGLVGRYATRFERPVRSAADVAAEICARRVTPVRGLRAASGTEGGGACLTYTTSR